MPSRRLFQNSAQGPSASSDNSSSNKSLVLGLAIGGGAGVAILLVALLLVLYRWYRPTSRTSGSSSSSGWGWAIGVGSWIGRLTRRGRHLGAGPEKLQKFSYRELKNATDNFSPAQRLGQGGFGAVFKGALRNGKDIAVKKLDTSSLQGEREFQNEVSVIGRVNSPHVVGLLGYCTDGRKRLLVYEYMENGSLQEALFDDMYAATLDWETRFKVMLDTARGLAFLHYKCEPPIIHGDVKPSNILLDKHFAARIADFGLARLKPDDAAAAAAAAPGEEAEQEKAAAQYERAERDRTRRVARRRDEDAKKKMQNAAAAAATASAGEGERPTEGDGAKRAEQVLVIPAPKSNEFVKGMSMEVGGSSPSPANVSDSRKGGCFAVAGESPAPTVVAGETSPQQQPQVEMDISGPSVTQSPMSVQPSPTTVQSSSPPSVQQESPITDTETQPNGASPANDDPDTVEVVVSSPREAGSPNGAAGKKKRRADDESSPAPSSTRAGAKQMDDGSSHAPDVSAREDTEAEGWSTLSPSEGYRDDVSVESGRSGTIVGKDSAAKQGGRGGSQSKRLWNRDWWWRQDSNSGELTIKDFINWTPSKSVASSESRRRTSISKDGNAGEAGSAIESSGDTASVSQSRRLDKKRGSRSSVGSGGWGEFSGELIGLGRCKREQSKREQNKRGKDKYTMREWWKEEEKNEAGSRSKRDHHHHHRHSKSRSRDSFYSKAAKVRSREWWRDETSGELSQARSHRGGSILSLSRDGSKREKGRSREWWREEYSGELSRTSSKRHSGQLRKEGAPRREKSRSRDWFSGDLLGRAAVTSTPSMRGTICYVAPEYGGGGILNEKSDVYSFGVLMLVIISGRRPLQVMASPIVEFERANLISWARLLAQSGNVLDLVDGVLHGQFSKEQAVLCITVALLCLQRLPAVRPTMGEVVKFLLGEADVPSLPFDFSPSPNYFRSRQRPSVDRPGNGSVTSDAPLLSA